MSQFLIYGLTALGTAVFDLIDSAFGNNLGIDSICVMSSVIVITWCMGVAGNLGRFAFDVKQSCVADCAVLQLIASVVVGGIVWVLQGVIPHVYSLTAVQYALMQKCLAVYAIFFPIKSMSLINIADPTQLLIISYAVYCFNKNRSQRHTHINYQNTQVSMPLP